ncbi:MAG: PadR family transcriptional regulator [Acidobacteriota bacterium]|jgi:DNA-binding PadR family transcriptional regulator
MGKRRLGYATVSILRAIDEDHRYGLEIIDATGLATGTVYVTLGRLQKRGFVTTSWEDQRIAEREGRPRRRYYRLSSAGRDALQEALESYDALTSGAAAGSPRR